jgi:CHAT domain-containing protein
VDDAATSVLMERFYFHLWQKKLSKLEALRQAQLDVLRHPEWAERRVKELARVHGLRHAGKVSERIISSVKERRSPVAWWAAWQLSGDWR